MKKLREELTLIAVTIIQATLIYACMFFIVQNFFLEYTESLYFALCHIYFVISLRVIYDFNQYIMKSKDLRLAESVLKKFGVDTDKIKKLIVVFHNIETHSYDSAYVVIKSGDSNYHVAIIRDPREEIIIGHD